MKMTKVTMNLTDRDIKNTETLTKRLHSRSKASAVSSALAIAEGITRSIERGEEVLIRTKDGALERVLITGAGSA
ncbi:MAG: hypothetical protein OXF66_03845 [Gammaproteobacteria bacterium]|nr:hypothetical protein [Gammaproteobacteria bacterium]